MHLVQTLTAPWIARFKALAALPIAAVTWGLVVVFSSWIVLDLTYLKISSGLSQSTYDAMVKNRFHAAAPDPRLVIVDIDEASLARMSQEFGRWPWPRDTLASVQDFIEQDEPLAIVWDIAFADADKLNPGGDAAFNASAKRSLHSHYSVIRLPAANDSKSQLTQAHLPSLWVKPADAGKPMATLAAIVPVLPHIAAGKLGFNNGYADDDGVLRRYRYAERLSDGSIIQSTPLSAAGSISTEALSKTLALPENLNKQGVDTGTLMAWRKQVDVYPKLSFADVFAKAEGAKPHHSVPSFKGKIVIVGSTAPSLHDVHPTPLASFQAGVETLTTAVDNALNARFIHEIPRWLQAVIAIGLCAGLAVWVRRFGIASLDGGLVILPGALLGLSYLSLNLLPVFLDLQLAAGAVLLFLAALRTWNNFRRNYWCALPTQSVLQASADASNTADTACGLMALHSAKGQPFADTGLDHLIDCLEKQAPQCRVLGGDTTATWPAVLRWPELAHLVGITGPMLQLREFAAHLPGGVEASTPLALTDIPANSALAKAHIAATYTHRFFRSTTP